MEGKEAVAGGSLLRVDLFGKFFTCGACEGLTSQQLKIFLDVDKIRQTLAGRS